MPLICHAVTRHAVDYAMLMLLTLMLIDLFFAAFHYYYMLLHAAVACLCHAAAAAIGAPCYYVFRCFARCRYAIADAFAAAMPRYAMILRRRHCFRYAVIRFAFFADVCYAADAAGCCHAAATLSPPVAADAISPPATFIIASLSLPCLPPYFAMLRCFLSLILLFSYFSFRHYC